jgi:hypothetical protein
MGKGNEMGLVFGALGLSNAVSHIVAPGTYAAIYGATVAAFPKAMFIMSAALLYIAVSLLARIRPNIHIPPEELEGTIPVPSSEEVEVAGAGSYEQARSRSRSRGPENDALGKAPIFLSLPED